MRELKLSHPEGRIDDLKTLDNAEQIQCAAYLRQRGFVRQDG